MIFDLIGLVAILIAFLLLFWLRKNSMLNLRNVMLPFGMFFAGSGMVVSIEFWSFGFTLICIGAIIWITGGILQMRHALRKASQLTILNLVSKGVI